MIITYYKGEPMPTPIDEVFEWSQAILKGTNDGATRESVWLAGGSLAAQITNETPKDYDFFFRNELALRRMAYNFEQAGAEPVQLLRPQKPYGYQQGYAVEYITAKGSRIHLVNRQYYQSLDEVLNDFDFTACMIGAGQGYIAYDSHLLSDLEKRTLRFNKFQSPHSALIRVQRYAQKGFSLDESERQKLLDYIVLNDSEEQEIWSKHE